MAHTLSTIALAVVGISTVSIGSNFAKAKDESSAERDKRIHAAAEALASPNAKPQKDPFATGRASNFVRYPPEYDHAAQKRVLEAADALVKEGVAAFPELVAHIKDNRYSCTEKLPMSDSNHSVGWVCVQILKEQVYAYEDYLKEGLAVYYSHTSGSWPEWVKQQDGRTLRELQLEAAEQTLEWLKDPSKVKGREGKFPPTAKEIEQARVENVKILEKLVERLKAGETLTYRVRISNRLPGFRK